MSKQFILGCGPYDCDPDWVTYIGTYNSEKEVKSAIRSYIKEYPEDDCEFYVNDEPFDF